MSSSETYYRKGFGLKSAVQGTLDADYSGGLVDLLREREGSLTIGDVTIRLAREFGFCYGVERAVEYAYQTRSKFPDRRIFLVGEIIHNPHVNAKLRSMGITILQPEQGAFDYSAVTPQDVVILPAFGVTIRDFETLRANGCVVVDTTCGSVLNVWKRVESYAKDEFTALIHGKYYHEETRATASQVTKFPGGQYLIVRDMAEAKLVCEYIEGTLDREGLMSQLGKGAGPGFDPEQHLARIGVANQTTMLARESLAIAEAVGDSMARAFGESHRAYHFRSFDTICSATQDRQDAVDELLREPLDAMLVIGGYNSSNTISLAAICATKVATYHVEDATCIDPERGTVRHWDATRKGEVETAGWLASSGALRVGITAGASTPNNKIGDTVVRVLATPPGIVELSSDNARVAFVPAQGGRVIALLLGGRQWLADGERGGITECFPTIAACSISSGIPSLGGQALPAGGEIAARAPSFTMETHDPDEGAAALRAVTEWTGERAPWRYSRELRVVPDAVVMRYTLTNEGDEKLPFLWGARAALPLGETTTLELPDSSRTRIGAQQGIDLLGVGAEHRWPKLRSAKAIVDFSRPDAVARKFSCTLFVDLAAGRASVTEGAHRLHVEFDASRIANFEVSVERRGWAPFGGGSNTSSMVIAPRIGVPDSLSEALGGWNGAQWVAPGETREWEVVYRGERLK